MIIHYTNYIDIDIYDFISYSKTIKSGITLEELNVNLKYYLTDFLSNRYYIDSDNIDEEDIDTLREELEEIWDA